MMTLKRCGLFAASLGLAACASGPSQQAIHDECRMELAAARTAVQLRDQGKDKQSMLRTLPPLHTNSTRLLHQLYTIVDDVYACPELNDVIYGAYRYINCNRELRHQPANTNILSIKTQLQNCQANFDGKNTQQAIACVRATLPAIPEHTIGTKTPE